MNNIGLNRIAFYGFSFFIMICYILPQIQVYIDTVTLAFISLSFSVAFIFRTNSIEIGHIVRTIIPYILLMFLVAIPFQLVRGFLYPSYLFWNSIFPALLCHKIIKRGEFGWALFLLCSSFIVLGIVLYNTTGALAENENIMRSLTSGKNEEEFYILMKSQGVGGYGIAYSSGMLTVFFASLALYFRKIRTNNILIFISIFVCLIFAWFSYNAQFTTLIIITLLSIGVSLLYYSKSAAWRALLVIGIVTIFAFLPLIVQFLIQDNIDNSIGAHMQEIYDRYWGSGTVEEDIRALYRKECFVHYIQSPIWGQNTTGEVHWIYSHAHSSLLSILLATGLIGLISYYKSLHKAYNMLITNFSIDCRKIIFWPQVAYFLMLSYFNSSMAIELYWTLFLLIPLTVLLLKKRLSLDKCY